jgi:hypothetical protein
VWLAPLRPRAGRATLGHPGEQRIGDLLTEKVRVVELHHALAVLPPVAGRPGIAIDDRDFVPAPRQCHPGVQAGWPRANDDCPHASPPLPAVTATAKSPHNSNPRERPGIRSTTQRRKPDPDTAALHGRRSGSVSVETI